MCFCLQLELLGILEKARVTGTQMRRQNDSGSAKKIAFSMDLAKNIVGTRKHLTNGFHHKEIALSEYCKWIGQF